MVPTVVPTVATTGTPGDEERGVVVRGMAVVLDVLALLPDAEVVESRRSVEAHRRAFLFTRTHRVHLNARKLRCRLSRCIKSTGAY